MRIKHRIKYRKPVAAFLLMIMAIQTLFPATAMALTSGPAQPEASSFKQAGVSDMVDLFTGNFNYNLPLLDVDGYPVNLSYQSGSGVDDEASWVGLGWNINVGAVNRQLRGIADDMSGDVVTTEHYTKPKVTVGGRLTAKVEIKGKGALKNLGINGSFSLGVFSDNYTGIGAELGANAGLSYSFANGGGLTAGMGLGLMSNTQSGVDVTPSLSLSYRMKVSDNNTVSPGLSASIGYNTRGGLKGLTLGSSFSVSGTAVEKETGKVKSGSANYDIAGSTISYNTDPVSPKIQVPYRSSYGSFSFDIGGAAWLVFAGGGGSGYKSVREVKSTTMTNPAFGFLYAERGKKNPAAMMDFLREKESIIIPELPNLAVPVATPDIFSYTSQGGSGQFRLYRGGSGVLFDNKAEDESSTQTLGFDVGIGAYAHGGVTYYEQNVKNITQKWTKDNQYLNAGDFQEPNNANPGEEHVFFKQVGEKNQEDSKLVNEMKGTQPIAVEISGKTAKQDKIRVSGMNGTEAFSSLKKISRQKKRTSISFLTAEQAAVAGLDKRIWTSPFNDAASFNALNCHLMIKGFKDRYPGQGMFSEEFYKKHHISEITVTDEGGKRSVYGIPVYNKKQVEYSFAIGAPGSYGNRDASKNTITFNTSGSTIDQKKGEETDHYLHKDEQPAYTTSYLLTGILSPDYVDLTGNGISDDDPGTAIKFNYTRLPGTYKWRSPYTGAEKQATIQKGLLADPDDDKASFVYGEKEMWYLHSIETKTKIAYFLTEDRLDGLGVKDIWGEIDTTLKQKRLAEIRLYSKADHTRPIKIVKLRYSYELCKGLPNFVDRPGETRKGKLTLDSVYFQYGHSPKGALHPYVFHYIGSGENSGDPDYAYDMLVTDRWGSYKSKDINAAKGFQLGNDEFPYTIQNNPDANAWAGLWQLSRIELPTGGEINVTYEPDDYAYVQNKRAMVMMKPDNLMAEAGAATNSLINARGLLLTIPEPKTSEEDQQQPDDTRWFINKYLNGSQYMYTKLFVNLGGLDALRNPTNLSYYDFVPCYAKIRRVEVTNQQAQIWFENVNESDSGNVSPILLAAWQRLRLEYPRYAYPGYKNRIKAGDAGKAIKAAVTAIVNAAGNLDELRRSFNERAKATGFCANVSLEKSFVRITDVSGRKQGGGNRVKKISISDKWADMSGNNTVNANYGQEYSYTTTVDGEEISSGVASYEPSVGGDENPIRQPIPYVQKIRGAINNFFNLEEPFGESLFPGATVGYSKATVRDLDASGNPDPEQKTGYIVHEFYTAREFPVIVQSLPNKMQQRGPSGWYSFFGSSSVHELTFSQGYSIELNDMHGKPKANRVFNQSNAEIASTEYFYNAEPLNAGEMKLKNLVTVVNEQGQIEENQVIGREIEVFTDMREQETSSLGQNIATGADVFPTPFFGIPGVLPHWPIKENDEYKLFRSASTMKVIQYYGIIDKVVKTENGSSATTENLAYDGLTGEVVITKTANEFEQPVYSISLPAYWIHPAMGGAYKNSGALMVFGTNSQGQPIGISYSSFMQPGDELFNFINNKRYWVAQTSINGDVNQPGVIRIIDEKGKLSQIQLFIAKVIRSGYRNLLTPPAAGIVCLSNPISTSPDPVTGKKYVVFSNDADRTAWKILTASASVYDDTWGVKPDCATCPPGYTLSADGTSCIGDVIENTNYCFTLCSGSVEDDGNYGLYGASIQETSSSTPVTRTNQFWGGACCSSLLSTQKTVQPGTAIKSKKVKSDSSATQVTASTNFTTLAAPPAGGCHRTSYQPNNLCQGNFCGRLVNTGLWLCETDGIPAQEWMAFEACIDIQETKTYYIGYAVDNQMRIYVDGVLWQQLTGNEQDNFRYWHVKPYNFTYTGQHSIRVEFYNESSEAAVGLEVYDNTFDQLTNGSFNPSVPNIIFSTANLMGPDKQVQVFRDVEVGGMHIAKYALFNGSTPPVCDIWQPVDRTVNPYLKGFLGNWRPKESKVFQVNRKYNDLFNNEPKGVDVKNAGTFEFFRPYWVYKDAKWKGMAGTKEWVTANTITLYDKYSQELENKDALGRYSAAGFVFKGDLPGAVASNARNREIFYESFEDYRLRGACFIPFDSCGITDLKSNDGGTIFSKTNTDTTHSGNYSLKLPSSGVRLATTVHGFETKQQNYTSINSKGEYTTQLGTGIYPVGFEPMPGKKYVFSAWVKDNMHTSNTPGISLTVNGAAVTLTRKAVVEKWKQVEGIIDLTGAAPNSAINITVTPDGGNVLLDDIRIHPFDSHMTTYAYDDKTLRMMAELDENNFATFYEYDDEGSLVRVKKETEKGIMTIKESRASYRKKPQQ